jgi:hypothetical protein
MGFRFSASAVLASALFAHAVSSQAPKPANDSDPDWIASIQAQVHDGNEHPISGLGPDDFILTEHGERDAIVAIRGQGWAVSGATPQMETPKSLAVPATQPQRPQVAPAKTLKTWVLVVIEGVSPAGRHFAIAGLQKFLSQPHPPGWAFALFDDAGEFLPFSEDTEALRSRLDFLEHHVSGRPTGGHPISTVGTAIEDLGIKPGRRAIVFASDSAPLFYIDAALRAQAPIYIVQASGPGTVVPFGSAEMQAPTDIGGLESSPSTGLLVADQIHFDSWNAGDVFTEFLEAADGTGGRSARDMRDAFEKIADDAAGFYRITFRPRMGEPDGALHPISVAVRTPHAHVRSARYYVAPTPESRQTLPAPIRAALKAGVITQGLDAAAHVWLFPDVKGVHTSVMAADISWPASAGNIGPESKLQIYAQLVDEGMGRTVGSWMTEHTWKSTDSHLPTAHWQREASLYPGTYSLRVIALDAASGRIGTRAFSFAIHPSSTPAFQFSAVVVASRCLDRNEMQGRTNLLDPMLLNGCLLSPSAAGSFAATEIPTMIVRLYPANQQVRDMFLKEWRAYVSIGDGPRIPLAITSADIRGLIATDKLDFAKLDAKPGDNEISVVFEAPAGAGKKHVLALRSQVTVIP